MPKKLILDMAGVTFMDSSGVALAVNSVRRMRELSGEVSLRGVPPLPMKILTMAGIGRYASFEEGDRAI